MIAFGPVPSRRLGRSLGVNNVPKKVCSYDCLYCQVGKTTLLTKERRRFFGKDRIFGEVSNVAKSTEFDYITFVPSGEPTLDIDLGEEIRALKELGKIAVITNASLLFDESVREELSEADWVSIKVDAVSDEIWKTLNRPADGLNLKEILKGIEEFSSSFQGTLVSETMLVDGMNTSREELEAIADFLSDLGLERTYISVPIRPPAYDVKPPGDEKIDEAYVVFSSKGLKVEILSRPEEGELALSGEPKSAILSITAVHPLREDVLEKTLKELGIDWKVVEDLLKEGRLEILEYAGKRFYRKR